MHPIDRAKERFGIDLSRVQLRVLEQRIIDGKALLLGRGPKPDRGRFLVEVDGVQMIAAWSFKTRMITTFMVPQANGRPTAGVPRRLKNKARRRARAVGRR